MKNYKCPKCDIALSEIEGSRNLIVGVTGYYCQICDYEDTRVIIGGAK